MLTALAYEEYCVRQDAGEAIDPREFDTRFPAIAAEIRDLIDIHNFVDSSQDLLLGEESARDDVEFPSAGETIGGFRLVEELAADDSPGCSSHWNGTSRTARWPSRFHSRARGSRKLWRSYSTHTLSRIYSYQADVVTGLHLVCMPYFGRRHAGRPSCFAENSFGEDGG